MIDLRNYKEMIDSFYKQLGKTRGEITDITLSEEKWSLKEIVGHLIDSASNNHQRFVRLQFGDLLDFPLYEAEQWVKTQKYNSMNWDNLVTLWYSYNCLIINVIENSDQTAYSNVWIKDEEAIPFNELINQYFKHIEQHIIHFNNHKEEILNE